MDSTPDTRHSLLVRLGNPADEQAWNRFVELYEPLIYRLARRKGFQHADAEELTQEALVAVAAAIDQFDPDPNRGSFRGWLSRIARNMMINFLSRARPEQRGTGGTGFRCLLEQQPAPSSDDDDESLFGWEYRRELFRCAARQVRHEFHETTWQAFWQTSVEGEAIQPTAEALGLSVGSVYAARSRVMARIKEKVRQLEED
jgi:RNA polymerase sigma-70 factor (ECF subfamily)